ncbi:RHS repeat-associated core domain-containing protein [Pseudomonas sp. Irchel s3h17]|uniref:RHS repeat-associated core domain-containing protein n=1 Tax=Pseudomonas sp. Irchel s3h17 TaxID=2009182 RepID=UPI0021145CDF|nr:RHS repeat-associated core domain-containing protein [Pseudomonas sp. Irchel s3h17]
MGVGLLERASTRRFYQENYLATELDDQGQRSIIRHAAQPLAQQQSMAGVSETTLLATDRAHSLLHTLTGTDLRQMAYTAYGHHPAESGLSRLLGFNGECPDSITGHYLLGQGKRAYNPVLMRFNSPDNLSPFGEGGINSYAYCGDDPINFVDPTGSIKMSILMRGRSLTNVPEIVTNPQFKIKKTATTIAKADISQNNPMRSSPTTSISTLTSNSDSFSGRPSKTGSHTNTAKTRISKGVRPARAQLYNDAREYDALSPKHPDINIQKNSNLMKKIEEIKAERDADIKAGRHTKTPVHTERINLVNKRIKQMQLEELREKIRTTQSN